MIYYANMFRKRDITASKEDYLEKIYDLSLVNEKVRSIDVARALKVSRASVNKSLGGLKQDGYIEQEPYGTIFLTDRGFEVAKETRKRHNALRKFLIEVLGVSYETADIDACEMEHAISEETAEKLYRYLEAITAEN
ncbi:MAG: metal-dependent transcriptional regulator [Treponema sp.]